MFRDKHAFPIVLFVLCTLLVAVPSMAGPRRAEPIELSAVVELPVAHYLTAPADKRIDLSKYSFEFEGAIYSLEDLDRIEGKLSIEIDNEALKGGVARVSRIIDEIEILKAASCSSGTTKSNTASCVFYNVSNCGTNWTRRLTVACENLIGGITWQIRSLRLGCGRTCVGSASNCTGTLTCATGPAGTCLNVSGTTRCAGCFH